MKSKNIPYKKITYVIWNTKKNGGNKVIFEHVIRLKDKGYETQVLTINGSQPTWFPKLRVEYFFPHFLEQYGVVVATFWITAFFVFLLKAQKKYYFVQGWESDFYRNVYIKKLVQKTYTLPLTILVASAFLKKRVTRLTKTKKSIYKIPLIGITAEKPSGVKEKTTRIEIPRILCVISNYEYCKGPDILIDSVQKIKNKFPKYYFTLVSMEKRTLHPVFDTFIHNPSEFELTKLYRNSHFLLSTSRSEGFFLPALEAMSQGCIVISTDSGGITEIATHNKNSIIVKKVNELWEKNVIDKLVQNNKLRKKFIREGFKTAKQYNWSFVLNNLETIYNK